MTVEYDEKMTLTEVVANLKILHLEWMEKKNRMGTLCDDCNWELFYDYPSNVNETSEKKMESTVWVKCSNPECSFGATLIYTAIVTRI